MLTDYVANHRHLPPYANGSHRPARPPTSETVRELLAHAAQHAEYAKAHADAAKALTEAAAAHDWLDRLDAERGR